MKRLVPSSLSSFFRLHCGDSVIHGIFLSPQIANGARGAQHGFPEGRGGGRSGEVGGDSMDEEENAAMNDKSSSAMYVNEAALPFFSGAPCA